MTRLGMTKPWFGHLSVDASSSAPAGRLNTWSRCICWMFCHAVSTLILGRYKLGREYPPTYQRLPAAKHFPPLVGQLGLGDTDLPPAVAPGHQGAHGPRDNLVAETHADDTH